MNKNKPFSEAELIGALNDGNMKAFGELFDRYGKRLYHFSMGYLKSSENAEEIKTKPKLLIMLYSLFENFS